MFSEYVFTRSGIKSLVALPVARITAYERPLGSPDPDIEADIKPLIFLGCCLGYRLITAIMIDGPSL